MKCPACFFQLTPLQIGGVTVDVCDGGCGGAWFDAFELQRVAEADHASEELASVTRQRELHVDTTRKRACPRCDEVKLIRHFASGLRRVEVDHCPSCGGYWLDHGELDKVLAEKAQEEAVRSARHATISMATIREIYRLKLERHDLR